MAPNLDPEHPDRRAALFRETAIERAGRIVFGLARVLKAPHRRELLPLARLWLAELTHPGRGLPDPERTWGEFAGLVHDDSTETLVRAYRRGLFPSAHIGPLKWRSPAERCVLSFADFHIARSLRRRMRRGDYAVTFDRAFDDVIRACARPRAGKWPTTWITPRIMRMYAALFDAGHVHSFEVWNRAGQLAGGGYGVALGGVFFTESQFSRESNTSKIGFAVLNWHLAHWGYVLNDGKYPTPTILHMGFRAIPRAEFLRMLREAAEDGGRSGPWTIEAGPESVAEWMPGGTAEEASLLPQLPPASAHEGVRLEARRTAR